MKAILIDPFTRSVSEVETPGALADMYALIDAEMIELVSVESQLGSFSRAYPLGFVLVVDEEGALKPASEQEYFAFNGQQLSGKALIVGLDDMGEFTDCPYGVGAFLPYVRFLDKSEGYEPAFGYREYQADHPAFGRTWVVESYLANPLEGAER